jgi:hypothetical protein
MMCEKHTTKVYLNKEQAQRDRTKVKIREMKALHLFSVHMDPHTQKKMSGIHGLSKRKISLTKLEFG